MTMLHKHKLLKSLCLMFITSLLLSANVKALEVRLLYVGPEDNSALKGVEQGIQEANLQGQFLNQKYLLENIDETTASQHQFGAYSAIFLNTKKELITKLATKLSDKAVFNLNSADDSLRYACIANLLHTIPSNKMKNDAVQQWKKKAPDSSAVAQAWHPDFLKFAARDLNKRYKKNFNVPMDDLAWSGWAAAKMTSDTVARLKSADPSKLLTFFKTELAFDGQKGINMNFRQTGQLRQPMLLIEDGKIVAEAPVRGVANPPTLDSLGIINCEK